MVTKKSASKKDSDKAKKSSAKSKGTAFNIGDIFSFSASKGGAENFSANFEYHNIVVGLKGNLKSSEAKLDIKIDGKSFGIKGTVTVSEKSFKNLYTFFSHLLDHIKKH